MDVGGVEQGSAFEPAPVLDPELPARPLPSRPQAWEAEVSAEPGRERQGERALPKRRPVPSRKALAPAEPVDDLAAEPAEPGEPADRGDSGGRPSETRGFGAFYRDYLPQLLALLMIEGARPAVAADLAQDVMSAAYREWARIEKPREWTRQRALAAWIDCREEEGDGGEG